MSGVRLHLGCGLVHRPGWVNVDRYAAEAADVLADALLLPLPDGAAEAVEACQLVEHLGYVGTLYALYEWARVLAPGGTLLLETPDRPATLQAGLDPETRAAAQPWLWGAAGPGLGHRYLFDAAEMVDLASQAGFAEIEVGVTAWSSARPSLRLTARRGQEAPQAAFLRRLHRAVVAAGLVDPLHSPPSMAVVGGIGERAAALVSAPEASALAQLLGLGARYTPRLAACLLQAWPDPPPWSAGEAARARDMLAALEDSNLPARLACRWRTRSKSAETARLAWALLEREASLYLTSRLCPGEGLDEVRAAFDEVTAQPAPSDLEVTFFSYEALGELARRLTARGVRAWSRGRLSQARDLLSLAVDYHPEALWARWNLARLSLCQGQTLEALERYESLQAGLAPGLQPALEREVTAAAGRSGDPGRYAVPLSDPLDLLAG